MDEKLSVIAIIVSIVVAVWKIIGSILKAKAKKTETKIDDMLLLIVDAIIPVVEKMTNNKEKQKEIVKNEIEDYSKRIGINYDVNKVNKLIEENIDGQKKFKIDFGYKF